MSPFEWRRRRIYCRYSRGRPSMMAFLSNSHLNFYKAVQRDTAWYTTRAESELSLYGHRDFEDYIVLSHNLPNELLMRP